MAEAHPATQDVQSSRSGEKHSADSRQSANVPSWIGLEAMAASVNKVILVGNLGKRPVQEP